MLESILELDKNLFLFLNGIHNSTFDTIMYWVSDKYFWIPLYGFLVYLLYRHFGLRKTVLITLLIAVTFALCDIISVQAFKNIFHRLRPCHDKDLAGIVHLVENRCGGQWGFVSTHATNVFGLATIISFFLNDRIKLFGALIFLWAGIVSYSRVYLGVHYPLDIFCGALLGISIGNIIYSISKKLGLKI